MKPRSGAGRKRGRTDPLACFEVLHAAGTIPASPERTTSALRREVAVRYHFGGFTLDHDTRQLLSNGEDVHLSPKAFELLNLLVANRQRAVPKLELHQQLWPSTFVEETNLATLAAEIRRALGDSAASPMYLKTVYAFGYRFVGGVTTDLGAQQTCARPWLTLDRRHIPLLEGPNVIGRSPDAAIPIDSPGISRHHARIVVSDGEATLEDLGSKNGTQLNGSPIEKISRLSNGDQIRVGAVTLVFANLSEVTPTETLPADGA